MPKATTRPSSRPAERVMVFIDGSNLYHVLGQTCGRHDLQFDKFAEKLANGRDLRRVYYYNIRQEAFEDRSNATDQDKFLSSLYDTPHLEVKLGIWKQRGATMVEKGVDVMLAVDLVTRAYKDNYDTAIIVSGDADFYPALQAAKDVGKQVEVAAFDTNISGEAARVADLHIRLTKTYFTGLWMTRTQQRQRSDALRRPEVTDEAASPNGEDKAATKTATKPASRRRTSTSTRRPTSRTRASSRTRSKDSDSDESTVTATEESTARPAARRSTAAPSEQPPVRLEEVIPVDDAPSRNIRRTPSRRKVGGTASSTAKNGTNGASSPPRPPTLRKPAGSSSTESSESTSDPVPAE